MQSGIEGQPPDLSHDSERRAFYTRQFHELLNAYDAERLYESANAWAYDLLMNRFRDAS